MRSLLIGAVLFFVLLSLQHVNVQADDTAPQESTGPQPVAIAYIDHPAFLLPWPHDSNGNGICVNNGSSQASPEPSPNVGTCAASRRHTPYSYQNDYAHRYAVDFDLDQDTPVLAVADGTVTVSDCDPASKADDGTCTLDAGLGWMVKINHTVNGQVSRTVYAHLAYKPLAELGPISQGDPLGYVGNSGRSDGSHLHFELHNKGTNRVFHWARFADCGGCIPDVGYSYKSQNGAEGFVDVPPEHTFYNPVSCISSHKIAVGSDGFFWPDRSITRGEAARLMARWLERYDPEHSTNNWRVALPEANGLFDDLPTDSELTRAAEYLRQQGISYGYQDGEQIEYRPDEEINRGSALKWIVRATILERNIHPDVQNDLIARLGNPNYPDYKSPFTDLFYDNGEPHQFRHEILLGQALGISNGYQDPDNDQLRLFRPERLITRGEFIALMFRAMLLINSGTLSVSGDQTCPEPPNFSGQVVAIAATAGHASDGEPSRNAMCFSAALDAQLPNLSIQQDNTIVCYRFDTSTYTVIEDVPPYYWASPFVRALYDAGISEGCNNSGGASFCPTEDLSRVEMAIFLLRAKYFHDTGDSGLNYTPPPAGPDIFVDVSSDPSSPFYAEDAAWINELYRRGITEGSPECRPNGDTRLYYCPEDAVKRNQMAVFLLRTLEGPDYVNSLPQPLGIFEDVLVSNNQGAAIEELYWRGITHGSSDCGASLRYCPDDHVDRAHAATFLVRTFVNPPTRTERMGDLCFSTSEQFAIPGDAYEVAALPDVHPSDIVCYHSAVNQFKMYWNASIHHLNVTNIDTLSIPADGEIWFTTEHNESYPDIDDIDAEDVVRYAGGSFQKMVDGSRLQGEKASTLDYASTAALHMSLYGTSSLDFPVTHHDIVNFDIASSSFSQFFEGDMYGLQDRVDGASVETDSEANTMIYLSIHNDFCVPGDSGEICGDRGDVVRFTGLGNPPTSGSFGVDLCFDASEHDGLLGKNIDAIHVNTALACEPINTVTTPPGTLNVDLSTMTFSAIDGQVTPASRSLHISNVGEGAVNWTASEDADWLYLSTNEGTAPSTVQVSIDAGGLPAGNYDAQIVISAGGAQNSPWIVDVNLDVSTADQGHFIYLPIIRKGINILDALQQR